MTTWQKFSQGVGTVAVVSVVVLLISGWTLPAGMTKKGVSLICYATMIVEEIHFSEEGKTFCDELMGGK